MRVFSILKDKLPEPPDNINAIRGVRPAMKQSALEFAKSKGITLIDGEYVVLFHGTSPKNARAIERSNKLAMGTWFSHDPVIARRFGMQAISRGQPVVLMVKIDPSSLFHGEYWTLNEDVFRGWDGVYRPIP